MESTKDRAALSAEATLVLETLEAVSTGSPITIKVGKSPEHPSKLEAACGELSRTGQLETTSSGDLFSEYKFG
jgi:hypothetical protein